MVALYLYNSMVYGSQTAGWFSAMSQHRTCHITVPMYIYIYYIYICSTSREGEREFFMAEKRHSPGFEVAGFSNT